MHSIGHIYLTNEQITYSICKRIVIKSVIMKSQEITRTNLIHRTMPVIIFKNKHLKMTKPSYSLVRTDFYYEISTVKVY